jgi:hypothetical protein
MADILDPTPSTQTFSPYSGQGPQPQPDPFAPGRVDPSPVSDLNTEPADEPTTARTRLRDFEHDMLGEDTPRIDGHIERGHGSMYARLTHEERAQHTALERLVAAEQKVADTSAALEKAKIDHERAEKYVVACEEASKNADAERERRVQEAKARHDKRESEKSASEVHA